MFNDIFIKRKTVSVRYNDASETLDGDENKLKYLINYGAIMQTGDTLELGETYRIFLNRY